MSEIQSIVFDKSVYTLDEAIAWLISHDFEFKDIDIEKKTVRFRQHNPKRYKRFITIKKPGLNLIIGYF